MKRLAIFLTLLFLLIPIVQSKNAVFVSQYSSTSMDSRTLAYFLKVRENFNVTIVSENEIIKNTATWKNTLNSTDLVFVTSLSDVALQENRSSFCGNLSVALNRTKGIVFAGESLKYTSDTFKGCIYTSQFNLADNYVNDQISNFIVRIAAQHQITSGYDLVNYNLNMYDRIFPVNAPIGGTTLGTVNGDPDGSGPLSSGDYPFLIIWEGLTYRVGTWGITTQEIEGCVRCLEWKLFHQLLEWVSNTSDMGFKIKTDKETYSQGEQIFITVESPVDIGKPTGKIKYPNKQEFDLTFFGSGIKKIWNSNYYLLDSDPDGKYTIEVEYPNFKTKKEITAKAFEIDLSFDNKTKDIIIAANISTNILTPLTFDIDITITKPSGSKLTRPIKNTTSTSIVFEATESGKYLVSANATDQFKRTDSTTSDFYFSLTTNLTFTPPIIEIIRFKPENITDIITIKNNVHFNITNINISATGNVSDYIELEYTMIKVIPPNLTETLTFTISTPADIGVYTGAIRFTFKDGEEELPITVKIIEPGILIIQPQALNIWIMLNEEVTLNLDLINGGETTINITEINLIGDLIERSTILASPNILEPEERSELIIQVNSGGVIIIDKIETLQGSVGILMADGQLEYIDLTINVVEPLDDEFSRVDNVVASVKDTLNQYKDRIDTSKYFSELQEIEDDIETARNYYEGGSFEEAIQNFNLAENALNDLNQRIQSEIEGKPSKESNLTGNIMILFVIIIAAIGGWLFYSRYWTKRGYKWLYKKWGR